MIATGGRVILDRSRLDLVANARRLQPFHIARELGADRGRAFIDECRASSLELARDSLRAAIRRIGGDRVRRCAVLMASGRSPALDSLLEKTLASHAAIHAAEGEFFREVVIHAASSFGLAVRQIKEKELFEQAARELGEPAEALRRTLDDLGRMLGPPWRQDQKFAALAAWLA